MRLAARIAALLGAVDAGAFLASRPHLFRQHPERAVPSAGVVLLWLLLGRALGSRSGGRSALPLAATVAAANGTMLAVHIRHRIASPRVFVGAALSGICLAAALRRR